MIRLAVSVASTTEFELKTLVRLPSTPVRFDRSALAFQPIILVSSWLVRNPGQGLAEQGIVRVRPDRPGPARSGLA